VKVAHPNRLYPVALWIDRWIGTAMCAVLLPLKRLRGRREPLASEDVQRVLLLKMWGMGSIVLASPLIARIHERFPNARIDFVTLRENAAILELYPSLGRRLTLDLGRGVPRFLLDTARTLWTIRRARYDLLLDLEFFTRFSALFSFFARTRRSHGFSAKGKWRGRLHDVEVPFNAYNHVSLNFLDLLQGDPMEPVDPSVVAGPTALIPIRAPEGAWEACQEALESDSAWRAGEAIVVVNPNAGDMALERRWPLDQVAELLKHLCGQRTVNVVVTGSRAEREYVESVVAASGAGSRIVNLAGRIDIDGLVALLEHAAVCVTNDSGPLHIASAAGASTVALFGPETPVLYGPLRSRAEQRHDVHYRKLACSPCMFVHDNKVLSCWFAQAKCMTGITPSAVLASVDRLLVGRGESGTDGAPLRVLEGPGPTARS
jgi:ADP-heptose:LPS heptosyltransferase